MENSFLTVVDIAETVLYYTLGNCGDYHIKESSPETGSYGIGREAYIVNYC